MRIELTHPIKNYTYTENFHDYAELFFKIKDNINNYMNSIIFDEQTVVNINSKICTFTELQEIYKKVDRSLPEKLDYLLSIKNFYHRFSSYAAIAACNYKIYSRLYETTDKGKTVVDLLKKSTFFKEDMRNPNIDVDIIDSSTILFFKEIKDFSKLKIIDTGSIFSYIQINDDIKDIFNFISCEDVTEG